MRRRKVIVFSIYDFSLTTGSIIWAQNVLATMARLRNFDITVVLSGPPGSRDANLTALSPLGLNQIFIPFRESPADDQENLAGTAGSVLRRAFNQVLEKYYFQGERESRAQRHIDAMFAEITRKEQPDLVAITSVSAAFYIPSVFSQAVPCCLLTTDNVIPMFEYLRSQGGRPSMGRFELWLFRHGNWVANLRMRNHVNGIYRKCAGMVALTGRDLPEGLRRDGIRAVIPPVLPESDTHWTYSRTRCLLFVGSIFPGTGLMHFPNRQAIEWICDHLAPELLRIDDTVRINIIGATRDQVAAGERCRKVEFLGRASRGELMQQMTTADLFIAPIAYQAGAKMKLAECVSYGMPFVATDAAMSGLPFLKFIPRIDLHQPAAAARLIVDYINAPERLISLSQSMAERAAQARSDELQAWNDFLEAAAAKSVASELSATDVPGKGDPASICRGS